MCLAIPGKIIKINKEKAIVDFNNIQKEINISLIKVKIGDYVIVHAGFAIEIILINKKQLIYENR
ncbi:MAG: HypC/HybG/HupF family hydrogenase formation chaperone [Patescibacteria group bacterium]|nr:HypC/HybG/HupF family hydrogenase formation chaperone [Patescibacteria group bacterium]MBU1870674.1 HypC/HybG/HupF family hydrogenase formation chaperone [Patescibacteria group bacterium]